MPNKCDNCYWSDSCGEALNGCDDYTPLTDDIYKLVVNKSGTNSELVERLENKVIEVRRRNFRHEWNEYIEENIDNI